MNLFLTLFLLVFFWLLFVGLSWLFMFLLAKSRGIVLKGDEFYQKTTGKHGQLVDLRDSAPYKRSHMRGARNIPTLNFTQGKSGLRKDRDIFLYDDSIRGAIRVAGILKKQGFSKSKIFILRGGYRQYKGR
ncbi:Rhodanese-related sulfurtransferase [Leuconostocaceae bacterium R-53105]|uniref:Rhodanese-related sulfurtransferase n=1 Tax=Convivina intestini TaxID=1505726 RepID=A0A2U1D9C1_9LACO|nr:rhodanese-like domain-containing protein [Convivina intestini]PVY84238.1 rhodanese-related sulfurtransferase [Convivina intestini]CAH1853996.1 hypothetical protein R077811_00806 [Convivina intestini]SDB90211.1 Rhodanese-related sulfurtransferase [Leuconostocaceae bacterium R-53105]